MSTAQPKELNNITSTPCKNCIFADYIDNTQYGCTLNILDKFREIGTNIIEAKDKKKDFYIIENRRCPYFRSDDWSKKHLPEHWYREVCREIQVRYDLIILASQSSIQEILFTIDSAIVQKIKPQITHIIIDGSKTKPSELIPLLQSYDLKWKIALMTPAEYNKQFSIIDNLIKPSKSQFYTIFEAGIFIPYKYSFCLNKLLNEQLKQVSLILSPDGVNATTIQVQLHKLLGGGDDLPERIQNLAEEQKSQHMIVNLEKLWELE